MLAPAADSVATPSELVKNQRDPTSFARINSLKQALMQEARNGKATGSAGILACYVMSSNGSLEVMTAIKNAVPATNSSLSLISNNKDGQNGSSSTIVRISENCDLSAANTTYELSVPTPAAENRRKNVHRMQLSTL